MSGQLADATDRRQILNEVPLEDGTMLVKGDTIYCKGEPGATFRFIHLAINPDHEQPTWVSAYGGTKGRGMHRGLYPDRVRVKKGSKAVRLAEYGDGDAEAFVDENAPEETGGDAETTEEVGEDFDKSMRADRRPPRGADVGALAEQIADGRVKAGTELSHGEHRAVVTESGHIEVAGEQFTSPSTAAKHAANLKAANGWTWWKLPNGDKLGTIR